MNEVLTVDYCLQSAFPMLVSKDLAAHGEGYSPKAADLLNELTVLARLSRAVNYYSLVTVYQRLEELYQAVRSGQSSEAYWMQCREAELLVKTVHDAVFQPPRREKSGDGEKGDEGSKNGDSDKSDDDGDKNDGDDGGSKSDGDKTGENDDNNTDGWLEPPLKWKELERVLGQLDRATVAEKRVLLHVMNAKSMLELHNFLVDPPLYMPAMLRRALARHIALAPASCAAERALLKKVQARLARFEPGREERWLRRCVGYQQVTETLDSGESCIELRVGRSEWRVRA